MQIEAKLQKKMLNQNGQWTFQKLINKDTLLWWIRWGTWITRFFFGWKQHTPGISFMKLKKKRNNTFDVLESTHLLAEDDLLSCAYSVLLSN